jgi:hypothetical protein
MIGLRRALSAGRALSTAAGESFVVRQARRKALLNQQRLPPVRGEVQGLWRQMLLRDDMKEVRASVTGALLKSLRESSATDRAAGGKAGSAIAAEDFATAVPQAVPRALRLVWKREQRFLALRRRAHELPERVSALERESPELAQTLASFVAGADTSVAGVNPLFGEATLRTSVLPSRRRPPRDATEAYKRQLYNGAMDNLRLLLSGQSKPAS